MYSTQDVDREINEDERALMEKFDAESRDKETGRYLPPVNNSIICRAPAQLLFVSSAFIIILSSIDLFLVALSEYQLRDELTLHKNH